MNRKIAIITGAGRGIGRAAAIRLASEGFNCVLVSRSPEELSETASLCATESLIALCDVRDADQIASVARQALDRFGQIDALVNNAGFAPLISFDRMTDAIWQEVIDTNLSSVYRFCHAVWEAMVRRRSGVIVNVSSEASRDPFPGFTAYAAAKAGVNLFTRALAKEGAAYNIRVHAIAPAGVETTMLRKIASPDQLPPETVLRPDDVAGAIRACIQGDLTHSSGETIFIHRKG
jgi:NAD(P)-dependent dehydrogenase (short-subunit alcohol dehydrogenase family)